LRSIADAENAADVTRPVKGEEETESLKRRPKVAEKPKVKAWWRDWKSLLLGLPIFALMAVTKLCRSGDHCGMGTDIGPSNVWIMIAIIMACPGIVIYAVIAAKIQEAIDAKRRASSSTHDVSKTGAGTA